MKLVYRSFQLLTGRWMRQLVWLPLSLFAVLCCGATMQALGLKLSLVTNKPGSSNSTVPIIRYLDGPNHTPSTTVTHWDPRIATSPIPSGGGNHSVPRLPSTQYQSLAPSTVPVQENLQFSQPKIPSVNGSTFGVTVQPTHNRFDNLQVPLPSHSNAVAIPSPHYPATNPAPNNFVMPAYGFENPNDNRNHVPSTAPHNNSIGSVSHQPTTANADLDTAQLISLSQSIRAIQTSDADSIRDRMHELLNLAIRHFDDKQTQEREQLKAAKESLETWEEAICQRDSLKKPLIESHIAQLMQSPDVLNWSFSGSELLKINSKEANYIEIVRKLWSIPTNQNATPLDPAPETDLEDFPPILEALPEAAPIALPVPAGATLF